MFVLAGQEAHHPILEMSLETLTYLSDDKKMNTGLSLLTQTGTSSSEGDRILKLCYNR